MTVDRYGRAPPHWRAQARTASGPEPSSSVTRLGKLLCATHPALVGGVGGAPGPPPPVPGADSDRDGGPECEARELLKFKMRRGRPCVLVPRRMAGCDASRGTSEAVGAAAGQPRSRQLSASVRRPLPHASSRPRTQPDSKVDSECSPKRKVKRSGFLSALGCLYKEPQTEPGPDGLPPRPAAAAGRRLLPPPIPPAGFTIDTAPPGDLRRGPELVGRTLLYWWPAEHASARAAPSRRVVAYTRQMSALRGTADTLHDTASYGQPALGLSFSCSRAAAGAIWKVESWYIPLQKWYIPPWLCTMVYTMV